MGSCNSRSKKQQFIETPEGYFYCTICKTLKSEQSYFCNCYKSICRDHIENEDMKCPSCESPIY